MQSWEPDSTFFEWETDPTFRKWNADACNNIPTTPLLLTSFQDEAHEETTEEDDEESEGEDLDEDSKAIIFMAIEKALLHQEEESKKNDDENLDKNSNSIIQKTYKCSECSSTLKGDSSFFRHKRMHIDERNEIKYFCKICYTSFKYQDYRAEHMKTKHGDKRYYCKKCNEEFNDRAKRWFHQNKCKKNKQKDLSLEKHYQYIFYITCFFSYFYSLHIKYNAYTCNAIVGT